MTKQEVIEILKSLSAQVHTLECGSDFDIKDELRDVRHQIDVIKVRVLMDIVK